MLLTRIPFQVAEPFEEVNCPQPGPSRPHKQTNGKKKGESGYNRCEIISALGDRAARLPADVVLSEVFGRDLL